MLNSALGPESDDAPAHDEIEAVVRRGPGGAIALAGIATLLVLGLWFAFYLFVFVPQSGGSP